jgi:hypothetical protein
VGERLLVGLAFMAIGVIMIVNRDRLARDTVRSQNRWFRQRQGEREVRINRWIYPFVGGGFVVFSLMYILTGD